MAVTSGGTPYVESSDLVANYPSTSLSLANKVDTKLDNALAANAQAGATYTFVLADARQLVAATNAGTKTFTIPPQSSVVWLANSTIRVVNYGAGALTIAGGSGVTVTNATKTLAQYESAALIRTGTNTWTLVPFSGGAGNADFSDAATGTYTDGNGVSYKYKTYTGDNTLTITRAGLADVLVVAGGAGGSGGYYDGGSLANGGAGGGAGGYYYYNVLLPVATHTVQVGAGGAGASGTSGAGSLSGLKPYLGLMVGGGSAASPFAQTGGFGGSGGGGFGRIVAGTGGAGISPYGNSGGNSSNISGGGGGGGAGGAASGATQGPGVSNSITGSAVTYAVGGYGQVWNNSVVPPHATANTGNGGSGGYSNTGGTSWGSNGGSGVVIIRVRTN